MSHRVDIYITGWEANHPRWEWRCTCGERQGDLNLDTANTAADKHEGEQ